MSTYAEIHARSRRDPEGFWAEMAQGIDWIRPWDKVLDTDAKPAARWFVGGELNTCWNAIDRHVAAGNGERVAVIYDSPVTGTIAKFTYAQMRDRIAAFAGLLASKGVVKGDRVIIYMPMVPEALVAMLACARLGAVHSVVFGGFAANELAVRIDDCTPKAIVSASCGIEGAKTLAYKPLLDGAIAIARHKPDFCVILQRPQLACDLVAGRDIDWASGAASAKPADCVPVKATDPLYVLYTSGTTGQPKGVVRDNGGHAVALAYSMRAIFDTGPGEVFWAASDVGWVVGHSYICYAPLLAGCTSVLFEGKPVGTPDAGVFWRVIAEHGVKTFFTAPTAFRAIRKEDPEGKFIAKTDLSKFRALFLAGERCDPATLEWADGASQAPGRRSLVADRDGLAHRRQRARHPDGYRQALSRSSRARRPSPCPAGTCRCWARTATRFPPATSAPSCASCRCRPAPSPRCGTPSSAMSTRISRSIPAITRRATRVTSTPTAIST